MTTNRSTTTPLWAAAPYVAERVGTLMYDRLFEVDDILAASIPLIRGLGVSLGGTAQHFGHRLPTGKRSMWIEDIMTGAKIRLDRPTEPGDASVMLDPNALARAAGFLQRATSSGVDVIVVNRFGNAEADGFGMRTEIAQAICSGAVVLIAVRFSLLDDLEGFLGCPANLLLPAPVAIADWVADTTATRRHGQKFLGPFFQK